jgi:hypothetical protein
MVGAGVALARREVRVMSRYTFIVLSTCLFFQSPVSAARFGNRPSRQPGKRSIKIRVDKIRAGLHSSRLQHATTPTLGRPKRLLPVGELTRFLFDGIKPGAKSTDWHPIPGTGDKKYLGWVHEAEAKFQVPEARMVPIEQAMAQNDLEAFFGPEIGAQFRAQGYFLEKQVKNAGTVRYADPYLDTPDLRATRQGISIRHRQIADQIGTENGMMEVKLYTAGKPGPVQERLEVRFRTDAEYSFKRMLSRDRAVEAWNPLSYLDRFDPDFQGQTLKPAVILENERLEYQLKDKDGKPAYLFTLDRVFGKRAEPVAGKRNETRHNEFEVEQMFADDSEGARARLIELTTHIENRFQLTRSSMNKPGTVAKNLGMLE